MFFVPYTVKKGGPNGSQGGGKEKIKFLETTFFELLAGWENI